MFYISPNGKHLQLCDDCKTVILEWSMGPGPSGKMFDRATGKTLSNETILGLVKPAQCTACSGVN